MGSRTLASFYSTSSDTYLFTLRFDSVLSMYEAAYGFSVAKEITLCLFLAVLWTENYGSSFEVQLWHSSVLFCLVCLFVCLSFLISQPQSWEQWKVGLFSRMLILDHTDTIIITFLFPFSCWVHHTPHTLYKDFFNLSEFQSPASYVLGLL